MKKQSAAVPARPAGKNLVIPWRAGSKYLPSGWATAKARRASRIPSPPEVPGALPIVGHLVHLVTRPLKFLREAQRHGEVVLIRVGRRRAYFVNQPDHLREMLVECPASFEKGAHFDKARQAIGDGLPIANGAVHRRHRKLIQPVFRQAKLRQYTRIMSRCTREGVGAWPVGRCFRIDRELQSLTIAIAAETLFSSDIGAQAGTVLQRATRVISRGIGLRTVDPTGLFEKLPIPANRRFDQARRQIRGVVDDMIQAYRVDAAGDDLLSALLAARDETGQLTDLELRDEAVSMMMTGLETVAQALKWTFYLLCDHPVVQTRVQQEVDEILGDAEMEFDDIERLPYCRRVLTEAMRMYPPAWFLSRRPIKDVTIGGCPIPAGSMVLFSPYALHHDAALYPDPDRFDPDRWLPGQSGAQPRTAYLPFGAGLRACIGEQFAWAEMLIVLSYVMRRWTLRRDPGASVKPLAHSVLEPDGLLVTMEPRVRSNPPATPCPTCRAAHE